MSQILGVKFNDYGQVYQFASGPFVVQAGQSVIVRTDQGMGLGQVVSVAPIDPEKPEEHAHIYRLANEEDLHTRDENHKLSRDAFHFCRQCVRRLDLDMKLVDVEVYFDRSKMIFYFTAPGRIDFRELIKDLVREYRTRIELRQIGVRHETQMLGAIGNCGQLCCCRRFLRKFAPVTIRMAKEQNLFLNPTKISGICGRLLCCLSYEQQGYEEFHRQCPKIGKKFQTSLGQVKVLRSNFFKKTLSILIEGGEEKEVPLEDWQQMLKKSQPTGDDRAEAKPAEARTPEVRGLEAQEPEPVEQDSPEQVDETEALADAAADVSEDADGDGQSRRFEGGEQGGAGADAQGRRPKGKRRRRRKNPKPA